MNLASFKSPEIPRRVLQVTLHKALQLMRTAKLREKVIFFPLMKEEKIPQGLLTRIKPLELRNFKPSSLLISVNISKGIEGKDLNYCCLVSVGVCL